MTVSRTELSRLQVLIDLADGRMRVEDAEALMGCSAGGSTGY